MGRTISRTIMGIADRVERAIRVRSTLLTADFHRNRRENWLLRFLLSLKRRIFAENRPLTSPSSRINEGFDEPSQEKSSNEV